LRETLRQISPECESRLPKRRKPAEPAAHPNKKDAKAGGATPPGDGKLKPAAAEEKPSSRKKPVGSGELPGPAKSETPKKKMPSSQESPAKAVSAEKALPRTSSLKKRPASEGLSKRKPR
jgi:hypothetical protein